MNNNIEKEIMHDWHRHDVLNLLSGNQNTGIELGVAEGIFSERMVNSGRFAHFLGVDMYADGHDVNQYRRAITRIGIFNNYKLLRMKFDEAIDLFDDNSFDFIYVDGYAHTGEEGGETIFSWFRKLKVGGVMAGDDYAEKWPLVVKAVDEFAAQAGLKLHITGITEPDADYCRYPTWAVVKSEDVKIEAPEQLLRIARIRSRKTIVQKIRSLAKKHLPKSILVQWARRKKD